MPSPPFLLLPLLLLAAATAVVAQPSFPPRGSYLINCGAATATTVNGLLWRPDTDYASSGKSHTLNLPGIFPTLSTLRTFPYKRSDGPRKFCYSIKVVRPAKYLVRTTYFYGGVGGEGTTPPVFDLVVDGTVWTVVNTTADYERNMASYYEGVYSPPGTRINICLAGRDYTESDPFISSIELITLEPSVYNTTNFSKNALVLVSRSVFGYSGPVLRYPDDQFDRFWQPFIDGRLATKTFPSATVSGFWNLPPSKIFETSLVAENEKPLQLQWPQVPLANGNYYIALYFLDSMSENSRVFDISVNGINFFTSLSVTSSGVAVFSSNWTLSGPTNIILTLSAGSSLPPLINGGEIFGILTLKGRTATRDVIALLDIKSKIQNPPSGWEGDPCFPREYSWIGITCFTGPQTRVIALNLSSMGLSGTLSPRISRLTALRDILLENNSFSGNIPDLGGLNLLDRLHLQDNQFSGALPSSLGTLGQLRELFVENNNLTGVIPQSLLRNPLLKLRTSPGNNFSPSP